MDVEDLREILWIDEKNGSRSAEDFAASIPKYLVRLSHVVGFKAFTSSTKS